MKYILSIAGLFMLASCGKFSDGTSVWADKVWLIPVLGVLGGLVFIALAWKASKSNSTTQIPGGTANNTGNVPITKLAKFWGGVLLIVFAIVVIIYQNSQR